MLNYPHINPIAWQIGPYQFQHPFEWQLGPFAIHWYGVMYLIGFLICWGIVSLRVKNSDRGFDQEEVSDILFYTALGVIIGGRLGYMLFYDWADFRTHPFLVFQVWRGGMSFHGGLIGVITALWIYARTLKKTLVDITDLIAPIVPIGLGLGRIGNFINGELWGRVTTMPWGMVFPNGGPEPRHPSQLYEFFFEGVVMFIILWLYSMKPRPRGAVSGLFLICYGTFRFAVEFFREPDPQKGYIAFGWMTEGQLFSFPMILIGIAFMAWAYRSVQRCNNI